MTQLPRTQFIFPILFCQFAILSKRFGALNPVNASQRIHLTTTISNMDKNALYALDFEVFGKVQGVFFRKYTEKQANSLGLKGWCMNTDTGTVRGQLEGPQNELNEMKKWLKTTGSPKSSISKAVFSEMKNIDKSNFTGFEIRR